MNTPDPPVLCLPQPLAAAVLDGLEAVPLLMPVTDADTGRALVYANPIHTAPRELRPPDAWALDGFFQRQQLPLAHVQHRVLGSVWISGPCTPGDLDPRGPAARFFARLHEPTGYCWASLRDPALWPLPCPLGPRARLGWQVVHDYRDAQTPAADTLQRVARFTLDPQLLKQARDKVAREPQPAGGFGSPFD